MPPIRRRWKLLPVLAACTVLVAACGSSSSSSSSSSSTAASAAATTTGGASTGTAAKKMTTVNVAYVPLPLFEPLFVAMSKGYFTQRGIDVKLTNIQSGQSAISLAASNKVQAVLGGFSAGMFNAINSGLNFKVVGSMAEEAPGTPANALIGSTSQHITSVSQLKGKKVAVLGGNGSAGAYLLAQALAPAHLTLSDVTLVNLQDPEMDSALKSGAVAAAYISTPFLGAAVSDGDAKIIAGAPTGAAVVGLIYGGQFASTPVAQNFFDALVQAAKQEQGKAANSPANLAIVAKATGESLKDLEAEPPSAFTATLAPPTSTLTAMQKVFLASKTLNYSSLLPSSKYVDSTFSTQAK